MFGIALPPEWQPYAAVAILLGMFVAFIRERFPVEVVAICGAALLVILGTLPTDGVMDIFSNSAPWTIVAMFVLVGSLVRTGGLDWISGLAGRHAASRPALTLIAILVGCATLSAFVNNTPSWS